jgi:tight adherence protein C
MMTSYPNLFLAIVFLVWGGIAAIVAWMIFPNRLQERLASLNDSGPGLLPEKSNPWVERIVKAANPFAKLSVPSEGWDNSPLRVRFINAGWRKPSSVPIFFATKTALALAFPLLLLMLAGAELFNSGASTVMLMLVLAAGVGCYLPNLFLRQAIFLRQREIFENFPDALDLLTICVEAGLALDQAISKVAAEIHLKSETLAQELQLVLMELRTGFSKEQALRHLALRTGVEEVEVLATMLIQSDRFGTSMGDSLRVHSDNLRSKRRQRAEETAAKIALKLLFPLIFFIFPTLLLVLLGPSMMQIYRVLLPAMTGGEF